MNRVRFLSSFVVGTSSTSVKRIRFDSNFNVGDVPINKRMRFTAVMSFDKKTHKRIRFMTNAYITSYSLPTWSNPKVMELENIIRDGKGSIFNNHLDFIEIDDDKLVINPGFIYNKYKEYYVFPDDYGVYNLGSNNYVTINKDILYINENYPYVITDTMPSNQFVETYNPVDSDSAYRKVCDVSDYTESLDGLTNYSFELDHYEYTISDSGTFYDIHFHPADTGDKYLVYVPGDSGYMYTNHYINIDLPDPYVISDFVESFLCVDDSKIIIGPYSVKILIPNKQYISGDNIDIIVLVRGINGEYASNYPILINGTAYTTNSYGEVKTSISATNFIRVKTNSSITLDSSVYSTYCSDFDKTISVEYLSVHTNQEYS